MATGDAADAELPEGFTVDKDARYTGTVADYNKWRGFGHITIDQQAGGEQDRTRLRLRLA
ncbi:CSD domain-containing protein [Durusdinium trenchii]|uniref:CSD domain-containing protein n=1 Tax=Durusdinium trenchii TaxID=1381693 RepID=A0ABP0Q970_9DINO